MRKLYTFAMYLGLPLILIHFALRGLRDRAYLQRWGERFGFGRAPAESGGILVHAASVGEVNAAAPLLQALATGHPDLPLAVTTFTPTGAERAASLLADRAFLACAPLDLPGAVNRLLERLQPRLLVVMETEIWPNLYAAAAARGIPILMANARMSERSLRLYRRWPGLVAATLKHVSHAAVQGPSDAERYAACGLDPAHIEISGNLKFDVSAPPSLLEQGEALRARWGAQRPVLLAGSTHDEDDRTVIAAFTHILETHPEALLIIVPRHPERFVQAAQLARNAGLRVELHSDNDACGPAAQCFVIDAMGELMRYYACCDVAFVGGTFADIGGHNVLEPAVLGKPVIVGPHTRHFEDIVGYLLTHGAALRAADGGELVAQVARLMGDGELRDRMGQAALAAVAAGRGAVERNAAAASKLLRGKIGRNTRP
jgi:3-deoxy-D-manno-octulosonic-acid transferase